MEINLNLKEKYNLINKILSKDAFDLYKKGFWLMGFFINLLVISYYEVIDGNLITTDPNILMLVYTLSMIKLSMLFIIICLWLTFRYNAIRRIEREKFIIKDPGVNPDVGLNHIYISIFSSIIFQDSALNFILHF